MLNTYLLTLRLAGRQMERQKKKYTLTDRQIFRDGDTKAGFNSV